MIRGVQVIRGLPVTRSVAALFDPDERETMYRNVDLEIRGNTDCSALATELSVAFDRIDTLERLLEEHTNVGREEIDRYQPDESVAAARAARRADIAERLLRPFRDFGEDQIARAEHGQGKAGGAAQGR